MPFWEQSGLFFTPPPTLLWLDISSVECFQPVMIRKAWIFHCCGNHGRRKLFCYLFTSSLPVNINAFKRWVQVWGREVAALKNQARKIASSRWRWLVMWTQDKHVPSREEDIFSPSSKFWILDFWEWKQIFKIKNWQQMPTFGFLVSQVGHRKESNYHLQFHRPIK